MGRWRMRHDVRLGAFLPGAMMSDGPGSLAACMFSTVMMSCHVELCSDMLAQESYNVSCASVWHLLACYTKPGNTRRIHL